MYSLPHYTEQDTSKLKEFMKLYNMAVVTGIGDLYPVASHLPLLIDENSSGEYILTGHMMRKTDHHLAFEKNKNVLAIFNSPSAYIHATWYNDSAVASTVNYMAVHAKGTIEFFDEKGTYEAIRQLTEKEIGLDKPGSFDRIPRNYIDDMLKAITGFQIRVTELRHVFKLSQNRSVKDREAVITALEIQDGEGGRMIATEMKKRL